MNAIILALGSFPVSGSEFRQYQNSKFVVVMDSVETSQLLPLLCLLFLAPLPLWNEVVLDIKHLIQWVVLMCSLEVSSVQFLLDFFFLQ